MGSLIFRDERIVPQTDARRQSAVEPEGGAFGL
jgi:hypothetical protein